MDNTKVQQLKRGTLEMILLSLIANHGCTYGYAIITALERLGEDIFVNAKPGTVYPVLYRLEEEGLICVVDTPGSESNRKKYAVTPKGEMELKEMIDTWNHFSSVVDSFI